MGLREGNESKRKEDMQQQTGRFVLRGGAKICNDGQWPRAVCERMHEGPVLL